MKYLKFFEQNKGFKEGIRYLLSYLKDDGFSIIIHETGTRPSIIIIKENKTRKTYLLKDAPGFTWDKVESDILTFIHTKKDILGKIEIVYRIDNKLESIELDTDTINDFDNYDFEIVRIQMHLIKKDKLI